MGNRREHDKTEKADSTKRSTQQQKEDVTRKQAESIMVEIIADVLLKEEAS